MKKVKYYSGDALDFHKDVLKAKRNTKDDPTYKKRMEDREDTISAQFTEYDTRFAANTLEGMPVVPLTSSQIADYLRLYRYKDKCFQDLEEKLSVDENGHEYPYCPLCDIGEYHSLDHILPKGVYPILCDHPKNLIRCCSTCNEYKSEVWLEGGKRKYLDLYIDDVPNEQVLFVELSLNGDLAVYKYYVSDVNHPNPDLYRMYKNGFEKLELARRYKKQTNEEITNMISSMKDNIKQFNATDDQLKTSIRSSVADMQQRHGVNYWRAILKLAFCDDAKMFAWLKSKAV